MNIQEYLVGTDESKAFERMYSKKIAKVKTSRVPKGLNIKLDYVKDGQVYFKVHATKLYLFKTILKIAWQNIQNPVKAGLVVGYAFYFLMRD